LKKSEFLRNKETSLFDENREEDLELLSYGIILENQIYYNRKAEYISLIEEYLTKSAGEDEAHLFVWEFFKIFKSDNEACEVLEEEILQQGIQKLATFQIDPKSTEFSDLVDQIQGSCEFFTFDPEDAYKMTLDQFRDSIQKIYLKF
jgi:hypothetical protein